MTTPDDSLPAHAYGAGSYPRFMPVGDAALTVEFGDTITPAVNAEVIALELALAASEVPGVIETAPSYRSLLVCYEPAEISFGTLVGHLRGLLGHPGDPLRQPGRQWLVPVFYGGAMANDLDEVAERLGLSPAGLVALHAGAEYTVFFMGFAPGLPNLGGLPPALHLPRRPLPRPLIPAGSVVMAGGQAGMMSIPAPSGWHILGHTPVRTFEPAREEPFLFRPGDLVRFYPIDQDRFDRLTARRERGEAVIVPDQVMPEPVT
jgi:KipI family sensor histidine kinase inhibitor